MKIALLDIEKIYSQMMFACLVSVNVICYHFKCTNIARLANGSSAYKLVVIENH